jgi:hypothetical protein
MQQLVHSWAPQEPINHFDWCSQFWALGQRTYLHIQTLLLSRSIQVQGRILILPVWLHWSDLGQDVTVHLFFNTLLLTASWMRVALTLGGRLTHCCNNQLPRNLLGCPWRVLGRLRIPDPALVWCWCLSTFAQCDSVWQKSLLWLILSLTKK